jgi:2-deoxy-D-gluconate 3-dehydrogenase
VALVTGGVGLLGAEFCRTLAEAGAAVAVVDLNASAAQAEADSLTNNGYKALALPTDITQPESVRAAVEKVLAAFGRIDILVNSAALDPKFDPDAVNKGIMPGAFEDYPLDLWNSALNVNLTGMLLMTQACVKPMIEQGQKGSIINICSTYGLNGPDQRIYVKEGKRVAFKPVYYTVTKAGVMGFTKYLAAYYAGTEIRVNALTPGGVFNNHEDYFVKNYSAKTILGRMAKKDEMNGALLFLASDASSYMTGNNVVVDGGWTAW